MTGYKSRIIPGTKVANVVRGGGSETIEWVSDGPMVLNRTVTVYQPGLPLTSYLAGNAVFCSVPTLPTGSPRSDNQVKADGDIAINATRPSSPSINLLTTAGELAKDGLPRLPDLVRWKKGTARLLQRTAGDYVSLQFEWLPLKREIQDAMRMVVKSDQVATAAAKRLSQRKIKVGYNYPTTDDAWTSHGTRNAFVWTSGVSTGNLAQGGTSYQTYSRTWFEGEYLYFFPLPKDSMTESKGFAFKAKHLLGLELTPQLLWDLAPWSWCADWLSNTDNLVGSISSTISDGMLLTDAFVMHHFRKEAVNAASSSHMSGDGKIARFSPTSVKLVYEKKTRFPHVPYLGFGGVGTLNAKQLSILAALGISRG